MKFLRGQAAIALSLAIPMMVGAACIGADMWALYLSSVRLQQAADAAVLSGAVYLPANPALAQSAARSKARMNGIHESEIVYNRPVSDGKSITMVVERKVPYRFARLFGLSQSLVTVRAVAAIGSSKSPLACSQSASIATLATAPVSRLRERDRSAPTSVPPQWGRRHLFCVEEKITI